MTPERFHTLVDAWGADVRRWPEHERDDALAWAHTHRAEADAALDAALELDAWLMRDVVAPPSRALVARIIASAPGGAEPATKRRHFWWPGAAFVGAGLAGAAAGALAVSLMLLGHPPPAVYGPGHDFAHESSFLDPGFGDTGPDATDDGSSE